jgi:RNA polymerase sigma-70 factor (ECF subfamily)
VTPFDCSPDRRVRDDPASYPKNHNDPQNLDSDHQPDTDPRSVGNASEQITLESKSAIGAVVEDDQPDRKVEVTHFLNLSNDLLGAKLQRYHEFLRRLAKSRLGKGILRRISPSDIFQESCLKAIANKDNFHGTTSREFRSWLVRIFLTQLADALRHHVKSKSRGITHEVAPPQQLAENDGKTPSGIAVFNETVTLLFRHFPALSPMEQQILLLRYWELLSFDEIADRLNVPRSTVHFRWDRALDKLEEKLLKAS